MACRLAPQATILGPWMAATRGKTGSAIALLDLVARGGVPPLSARLRIALDVLEPLTGGRPVKVTARREGSRLDVRNVRIGARGRAKLFGKGNRSGLPELLWEILACQRSPGKVPPPLSAVESDIEPEIESVIERAIKGEAALGDAAELAKELVIASAGQVCQQRDLARLVASLPAPSSRRAPDTIRSPIPPAMPAQGDELDQAVSEALVHGIGEGWESLLERTRSGAPPAPVAAVHIEDPETIDGDELLEELVDEPTLEEGVSPQVVKATMRDRPIAGASAYPRRTPPPLPQQTAHPARPDVLLVEPDAPTAAHVAGLLRREGFAVEVCSELAEVVPKAVATQPRCIVCDEESLGTSGPPLAEKVRGASPRACLAPFVFIGDARSRSRKAPGRPGPRDVWLKKPFATEALLDHVRRLTGEHGETPSQRPPSIAPPAGQTAIDGDLALFSLRSVLAMLEIDRRSGVLLVQSRDREARLVLQRGAVTQGTVSGRRKRPADALAILLSWDSGRFTFQMSPEIPADRWLPTDLLPRTTG